jgi:hypothetical protein
VYEPGKRSGAWVKFKLNQDQKLVIGGYIPGSRGIQLNLHLLSRFAALSDARMFERMERVPDMDSNFR